MNSLESVDISCPYCGESIEILIDCSVPKQSYVEDCEVCCQPWLVRVRFDEDGQPSVSATMLDDEYPS